MTFNLKLISTIFYQINPFHCIPTFVDTDGFTLFESTAIASYLVQSRAPSSDLYPAGDLKKRLTIDQFLFYNVGTLYRALTDVHYAAFQGTDPAPKLERLRDVLSTLNAFFEGPRKGEMVAGGATLTLADIAIYVNLSYIEVLKLDVSAYPSLTAYMGSVKEALKPYNADGWYEKMQAQLISLLEGFKAKMAEDQAKK